MEKQIKIALAGNPNCGKTTLFNALTGSNQFVGNWPGVTVEKKEGKLKKHDDVIIMDLPGIYSLSPYTLEEVVARNYLITERPDAILNIIDGTNLERNLYLTTQLTELGIPVVIAINMMDVVRKNGDQINVAELSRELGCEIVEISALKGDGVMQAAEAAVKAAKSGKTIPMHTFSGPVEHAIAHIEEAAVHNMPEEQQRWYAIKIFERDDKVLEKLTIPAETMQHIESDIKAAETELDDDAESIITNERYVYIAQIIKGCYKKKNHGQLSASDKIDKIVTNRWLGLPIFAVVMFLVYWVAMVGVGAPATDWANDGLFGDGWHLFGIGTAEYTEVADNYTAAMDAVSGYYELDTEAENFDADAALADMKAVQPDADSATIEVEDEETLAQNEMTVYYDAIPEDADEESTVGMTYVDAVSYLEENGFFGVAPGTSMKSNPNALISTHKDTIFTNVALDLSDNTVWWEGLNKTPPARAIDWRGRPWTPQSPEKAAHPNSRFTAPARNCPCLSPEFDNPEGVPISAIIFGGRRAKTAPLVYQSFNWQHGVFVGSIMASETTAAATGQVGVVRRDPMAMLPFCGYHMGDYWQHWLDMGKKIPHPPKIFNVNWFRTDDEGHFAWPGFGDNMRVLQWIISRADDEIGAAETALGYEPNTHDIDMEGLEMSMYDMRRLLSVDRDLWLQECSDARAYYEKIGKVPEELYEELDALEMRLNRGYKRK